MSFSSPFLLVFLHISLFVNSQFDESTEKYSDSLRIATEFSRELIDRTAEVAVQSDVLKKKYATDDVKLEKYNSVELLEQMRSRIEVFLQKKTDAVMKLVQNAESSYASYQYNPGMVDECAGKLDDLTNSKCFYRYYAARCNSLYNRDGNDSCMDCPMCVDNRVVFAFNNCSNPTNVLNCSANSRFYGKPVSMESSAVHVPTVIYERSHDMLSKIRWTDTDGQSYLEGQPGFFDRIAKQNRESDDRLGWQFFCSTTGFLRFYPAFSWHLDNYDHLDMYDCRLSQWYITAATLPKLMVILLDVSGSMLGQRYEIAKQTVEMILDTLSDNDYVNIVMFKSRPVYVHDCWQNQLVQATIRNKRILRAGLNLKQNEIDGIADYELGFREAFGLLKSHNCSEVYVVNGTKYENQTTCFAEDLLEKVEFDQNKEGNDPSVGTWPCNQAIMLITDGASQNYENVFAELNPDKRVQVFSYVIGEEVTELKEVRYMACRNRGYFAHISNLADVQGKIHYYVERMSRTLAMHNEHTPIWTGIYYDKMYVIPENEEWMYVGKGGKHMRKMLRVAPRLAKGRQLVVTVAAPVFDNSQSNPLNATLLGVIGTSVPISELQRLAPSYLLGTYSYTYMVDNNGYVVFHPQFRPILNSEVYGEIPKPNYNSIDILDIESEPNELDNTSRALRKLDYNSDKKRLDMIGRIKDVTGTSSTKVLVLIDDKRVFQQRVRHYYTPINNTKKSPIPYSIGMGVVDGSDYRVTIAKDLDRLIDELTENDISGSNWRVHPDWEYCVPPEEQYDRQEFIRAILNETILERQLPDSCKDNLWLMQNLLFDIHATCDVTECWISKSNLDSSRGVYLVFVATRSGLTRYADLNLEDVLLYDIPTTTTTTTTTTTHAVDHNSTLEPKLTTPLPPMKEEKTEPPYLHFMHRHLKTTEEIFYQRAIRAPEDTFVFDVDIKNKVWKSKSFNSSYGQMENYSFLITGSRAVYKKSGKTNVPVAVLGLEMMYDNFAQMLMNIAGDDCKVKTSNSSILQTSCYLLDENGYIIFTNKLLTYNNNIPKKELKLYFGAVHPGIMWTLVTNFIYEKLGYIDYQSVCKNETLTSSALRLVNPILGVIKLTSWILKEITSITFYSIYNIVSSLIHPAQGYTDTFRFLDVGVSCDEYMPTYVLNRSAFATANAKYMDFSFTCGRPESVKDSCGTSSELCTKHVSASLVPKTNLLLVIIRYSSECSKQECSICEGGVHKNYSHLIRITGQTALSASDKVYLSDGLGFKDPRHKKGDHSGEATDGVKQDFDGPKPKPPPQCLVGPRRRKPAYRPCHWRYKNYTEDDSNLFMCSKASRLRTVYGTPVLFTLFSFISLLPQFFS